MRNLSNCLVLFILLLVSTTISGQEQADSTLVQIETHDGNRFVGKITGEDAEKLVLVTDDLGELIIRVSNIKSRKIVRQSQIKNGELWFDNPQSTRYFWAPNGYGLKKGEGYYQNVWVLWNQFAVGLTDNFSIGATIIPLFLFGGTATPIFINPKLSFPISKNKINIGAGALAGIIAGESESGFGILYGVSTFGSPDKNISFGLGYAFAGGEFASSPLINIGGMSRLSSRWYFLSENYFVISSGESGGALSGGARWIIRKAALDFGLFIPVGADLDAFVALPWLGFTIPFGNAN